MRYEDMSPERKVEIDAYRDEVAPIVAAREAAAAAREARREDRLAEIPANAQSIPALKIIVQQLIDEVRELQGLPPL